LIDETNQQQALREKLTALDEQSKALSRKIGAAKKTKADNANQLIAEKKRLQIEEIQPLKAQLELLTEQEQGQKQKQKQKQSKKKNPNTAKAEQKTLTSQCPYPSGDSSINNTAENKLHDLTQLDADWDKYVQTHPHGSVYHQKTFLASLQKTFGHRVLLFCMRDIGTNKIVAALPLIEQKSPLFGHLWTSIAFVNYGGALADNASIEQKLLESVQQAGEQAGIKRLEIRGLYQRPVEWSVSTEKASMWLPLPTDHNSDTLLGQFKAKLRSQIKKGYTARVSYKVGAHELLNDFYTVFSRNMRDLGTPVYTKALFANLLSDLPGKSHIVMVYHDGKPASAAFLIQNNTMMEIPWASTIKEYNRYNLNMVLYWEVLKLSCLQGCDAFDFGRSTIDATTYKFKKQWGAQPIQHYWYSWEPQSQAASSTNEPAAVSAQNPKFQLLIRVWQKLPLWLANLLGPFVVKYIP